MNQFVVLTNLLRTIARVLRKMARSDATDGALENLLNAADQIDSAAIKIEAHTSDTVGMT